MQAGTRALQVGVIVPVFNEADNVAPLLERLAEALRDYVWEVIFVDDSSPDGSAARVREFALMDPRVRCVQRVGRRGLSSAVVEGMLASAAPILAVVDGDMQHDESVLPRMIAKILSDEADLVIGTRYAGEGSMGDLDAKRASLSRAATWLTNTVIRTQVSDPMSGFFAVSRKAFEAALPNLSNVGFKIMLDLLASAPQPLRTAEIAYTFRPREAGESKLDAKVGQEFLVLLLEKIFGHILPVRFLMFAAVGSLGLLVHLAVLGLTLNVGGQDFRYAQTLAVVVAMTFNFIVNNALTYRDMQLRGWQFIRGLATFYAVCAVGAIGNVGVGEIVYDSSRMWVLAGIAGAAIGVVWNYATSSVLTWKRK
ncbi:glycosyltransferase family 2 protein [Rhizorhapis sp. SPR117]|uniref:glycosyltransferase family 2 protein n=1 Tax=Rhizorhapis sp. SPR117 TaxID=2912611 RepID=UPI001F2FFA8E|nr:glycosyltransferase family 2 protein [Rhizorhapis sp. SPR117]